MKAIYFNDLRDLPNFGCRSTGAALESIMAGNGILIDRVDGLDSVNNSGWDGYANRSICIGGLPITRKIYKKTWQKRNARPLLHNLASKANALAGGIHDYIEESPTASVDLFLRLARKDSYFQSLLKRFEDADIAVINGEGTLIFANKTRRDALYLLFVIELAQRLNKPVYLLNAMVTSCPYEPPDNSQLAQYAKSLDKCRHIAVREQQSFGYVKNLVARPRVTEVPDALFTWHSRYKWYHENIQEWGDSTFSYFSDNDIRQAIKTPYITLSASSSAWRYGEPGIRSYRSLVSKILENGVNLILVESCAGDGLLRKVSEDLGTPLIARDAPLNVLAGVLSGSRLYISGRYHPGIASYCAGVPCIFMGSNSHKTLSVQEVVGINKPYEYSATPSGAEIEAIALEARAILDDVESKASEYSPSPGTIEKISSEVSKSYASIFEQ